MAGKADWFAAGLPGEGEGMEVPRIGTLAEAPCTCRPDELTGALRDRLAGTAWELCAVVGEQGVVLGALRPGDLDGDPTRQAERVMNPAVSTFRPDLPVEELRAYFARHEDVRAAPVTTPEGTLLGTIGRSRLDAAVAVRAGAG